MFFVYYENFFASVLLQTNKPQRNGPIFPVSTIHKLLEGANTILEHNKSKTKNINVSPVFATQ